MAAGDESAASTGEAKFWTVGEAGDGTAEDAGAGALEVLPMRHTLSRLMQEFPQGIPFLQFLWPSATAGHPITLTISTADRATLIRTRPSHGAKSSLLRIDPPVTRARKSLTRSSEHLLCWQILDQYSHELVARHIWVAGETVGLPHQSAFKHVPDQSGVPKVSRALLVLLHK